MRPDSNDKRTDVTHPNPPSSSTRDLILGVGLLQLILGGAGLWWGVGGVEHIGAALRDGQVLVSGGGGTRTSTPQWFYPYHAASHPYEFYAALIPWFCGPLALLSFVVIQGILVAVHVIGGPGARTGGVLKGLLWAMSALLGTASMALIFYWTVNLKPPPGQECIKWEPEGYNSIPAPGSPCDIRLK
jgi:hypothetical protein